MKTVKYIRDVDSPPDRAGKTGETRDLPDSVANLLAAERYVEITGDAPNDSDG